MLYSHKLILLYFVNCMPYGTYFEYTLCMMWSIFYIMYNYFAFMFFFTKPDFDFSFVKS